LCASRCKEKNTNISIQQQQHFFTSATSEGTIQIWSFTQADPLKSLEVSSTRIFTTALSSDDKWIVSFYFLRSFNSRLNVLNAAR